MRVSRNHLAGVVGNVLEWYDFTVFGFLAPIIGAKFFPSSDPLVSQLSAFGVFAVGYMMRPLAGMVYGHIGDRFGRRRALQFSMVLMAVPTTLLGLLPDFAMIGVAASILLILLRMLQGLSIAGEFVGSMSFISEIAPPQERGFYGSWTIFSALAGCCLGSAAAAAVHFGFTPEALAAGGWRYPFFAGIILGAIGLWLRAGMSETEHFEKAKKDNEMMDRGSPVLDALRSHPGSIVRLGGLVVLSTGAFTVLFVWWPSYLTQIVKPPVPHALEINTLAMAVLMILVPLGGKVGDWIGHRRILVLSAAALGMTAYPLFLWGTRGGEWAALGAQCTFALVMSGFMSTLPAVMAEMFPTRLRFSASGMGFNLSAALFGGTAPLVCTWLVSSTGDIHSPALYVAGMAAISLAAAWNVKTDQL